MTEPTPSKQEVQHLTTKVREIEQKIYIIFGDESPFTMCTAMAWTIAGMIIRSSNTQEDVDEKVNFFKDAMQKAVEPQMTILARLKAKEKSNEKIPSDR